MRCLRLLANLAKASAALSVVLLKTCMIALVFILSWAAAQKSTCLGILFGAFLGVMLGVGLISFSNRLKKGARSLFLLPVKKLARASYRLDSRGIALLARSVNALSQLRSQVETIVAGPNTGMLSLEFKGPLDWLERRLERDCVTVCLLDSEYSHSDEFLGIILPAQADWKSTFVELAAMARAIVLFPDSTEGALWEIETVLGCSNMRKKTIVVFPSKAVGKTGRVTIIHGEIEDTVRSKSEVVWQSLRARLREHGYRLPRWRPDGALYRPNPDLSIQKLYPSTQGGNRTPFEEALADLDQQFVPVRAAIDKIRRYEQER